MLTAALLLLTADVLDVDPAQGPYFEIRQAVDAANDGDLIRVHPGTYAFFGVVGKSVEIRAAAPGSVSVLGTIRIQEVPADGRVVVQGLDVEVPPFNNADAMVVSDCRGAVRVEDCDLVGRYYWAGVRVLDCDDVTFLETSMRSTADESHGLYVDGSAVTLWHCELTGQDATVRSHSGGSGIYARESDLFLHGGTSRGGQGGPDDWDWSTQTCDPAGSGGDGVTAWGGAVRVLDCALEPGYGGLGYDCFVGGPPGYDLYTTGTATLYAGEALDLAAPALVQEGDQVAIDAAGEVGDVVVLVLAPDTGRASLPGYVGDLHVGGPLGGSRRVFMGTGSGTLSLQMPQLAPFAVERFFLQTYHLRAGEVVFGPTRSLTILDTAW
ncbi:MAG: hypothetical protein AAGA20_02415 [Planctomycetota bacterium]